MAIKVLSVVIITILIAVGATIFGGVLKIENKSSSNVTVNVDGAYCCTAEKDGPPCTCPVSAGSHKLRATRSDNSKSIEDTFTVDEGETYTYTLTDAAQGELR